LLDKQCNDIDYLPENCIHAAILQNKLDLWSESSSTTLTCTFWNLFVEIAWSPLNKFSQTNINGAKYLNQTTNDVKIFPDGKTTHRNEWRDCSCFLTPLCLTFKGALMSSWMTIFLRDGSKIYAWALYNSTVGFFSSLHAHLRFILENQRRWKSLACLVHTRQQIN